jgi:hypothetical protein
MHTFTPQRGLIVGATPPCSALHDDNVLSTKRQEVIDFITSFGLTSADAENIVSTVGTADPRNAHGDPIEALRYE